MRRLAARPVPRWDSFFDLLTTPPDWRLAAPLLGVVAVAAALVAATVGFQAAYADRIAAGVTVMGVELGGRTRAEARALLTAEAAEAGRQPVKLRAVEREFTYAARDLGMNVDPDSLLDDAYGVGREGNPIQRGVNQWLALLGRGHLGGPAPQFDVEKQQAELQTIATQLDRPARDAEIKLVAVADGPTVQVTPQQIGVRMLVDQSAQRLRQALRAGVPTTVDLAVETEAPAVTANDFADAKAQADRMLSEPFALTFGDKRWTLSRDDIGRMVVFERNPGEAARVSLNEAVLTAALQKIVKEVDQPAQNARFIWTGSSLQPLRESQDGHVVDVEALRGLVREQLMADGHTVALPVTVSAPAVTTADASKITIRGLIKEGRTSFAGATAEKQHNVTLAASRLNGVVVPPGGLFSFNHEVGPTTLDAGFRTGWGIVMSSNGARTVPSDAGGICQVATTLFQPVFHSGYQIEERHWHLYWINSYGQPPLGLKGLDATVDEASGLDFQFSNTTQDYLLIQSRVEGSTLVFGLWGVKPAWDVKIEGPVISNVQTANPEIKYEQEPTMPLGRRLQVEAAQDGFESSIKRTVTLAGQAPRVLDLRSKYIPSRNVILEGTKPA